MDYKVTYATPDRIDLSDYTYRITTLSTTDDLARSIGAIGLLQPPSVIDVAGRMVVVCGFRRIKALLSLDLGGKEIPLRFLPPATPPMILAAMAISENSFQRPLNVVEQSRGIALLKRVCDPPDAWHQIARSSGLPDSAKAVASILPIVEMPGALQQAIVDGTIALPVAHQIDRLEVDDRRAMIDLLRRIRVGLNVQRELVERITEICRRDRISIARLLAQDRVREILENDLTPMPQNVQQLRDFLKTERFPALRQAEQGYRQAMKALHLPAQIQIQPPPFFEGKTYQIKLQVETRHQLQAMQRDLDRLAASSLLPD